jgi:hypothetical protein
LAQQYTTSGLARTFLKAGKAFSALNTASDAYKAYQDYSNCMKH